MFALPLEEGMLLFYWSWVGGVQGVDLLVGASRHCSRMHSHSLSLKITAYY